MQAFILTTQEHGGHALRPNTVLRGGYGIYYAILLYNNFQFLMANAPNSY
jgi:hypothetical protein